MAASEKKAKAKAKAKPSTDDPRLEPIHDWFAQRNWTPLPFQQETWSAYLAGRVIEYGEFERLGGSETLSVDVRIVAATNEDLPELARQNRFREDLLDRLAFDVITLPPLRERSEDILVLAEHFAVGMVKELGGERFSGFSMQSPHRC